MNKRFNKTDISLIHIKKCCSALLNCIPHSDQRGALLIGLIIAMTAVSVLGAGMLYFTSSSSQSELFFNNRDRAYYVAESGGWYAIPKVRQDLEQGVTTNITGLNGKTFVLSNGDKFQIAIDNSNPAFVYINSTGIVNEGGWSESKQKITYRILKFYKDPFTDDRPLSDNWHEEEGDAEIRNDGPSGHEPALNLKGKEAILTMNREEEDHEGGHDDDHGHGEGDEGGHDDDHHNDGHASGLPDLDAQRNQSDGLLSYELQIKVMANIEGGKGDYFVFGLSFRVTEDADSFYGISFFKGYSGETISPSGLNSALNALKNGTPHIILWQKVNDSFSLIDYKQLQTSDGVIVTGCGKKGNEVCLKDWSTLVVKVEEQYKTNPDGSFMTDGDGHRIRTNLISAYVQGTGTYPRNAINWNYNNFNPVVWHSHTQPIVNDTLTTQHFDEERPEIGIHGYYSSNAANDQFFDDFSMKLGSGSGTGSDRLQY